MLRRLCRIGMADRWGSGRKGRGRREYGSSWGWRGGGSSGGGTTSGGGGSRGPRDFSGHRDRDREHDRWSRDRFNRDSLGRADNEGDRRKRFAYNEDHSREESSSWSKGGSDWESRDRAASGSRDGAGSRAGSRGGGRGRGRGIPPGLKGKEIGLYFRDLARKRDGLTGQKKKKKKGKPLPPVLMSAEVEKDLRHFLSSIGALSGSKEAMKKSSDPVPRRLLPSSSTYLKREEDELFENNQMKSEPERMEIRREPERIEIRSEPERIEIRSEPERIEIRSEPERIEIRSESEEMKIRRQPEEVKSKREPEEVTKKKEALEEEKVVQEVADSWEDTWDEDDDESISDAVLDEMMQKVEELIPPLEDEWAESERKAMNRVMEAAHLREKYQHLGESGFKRSFLQCITGSIQERLERSLECRTALEGSADQNERFKRELEEKRFDRRYMDMQRVRERLPAFNMRKEIMNLIESNQVCLIRGETGCGKTTQVAQFILDHYITTDRGSQCRVICTQPRRISAIAVAQRVADERGENLGRSAGYQIRLEREMPRSSGSILFCTTGILLQTLQGDPALTSCSHLVLDEVHERDTQSDFVLTLVKDIIRKRPDLKVVLMSATLDSLRFSQYFNDCPHLEIPGFTYPVREYYLEDVLDMTGFRMPAAQQRIEKGWKKYLKRNRGNAQMMMDYNELILPYVSELRAGRKYPEWVLESLANPESEDVNLDLLLELIRYICNTQPDGAILVFLPGWDKIAGLHRLMTDSRAFPTSRYTIIPLHSLMPTTTQRSIFNRPPEGVRKIVLSTSIAETSITIDDVVYVIDTGKTKMSNFDVKNNIGTLKAEWVSKANAQQRRGRAGRVQPGVCYKTYSRARAESLTSYPLPEMLRTRLEEVVLQIKVLQLGRAEPFLARVLDPPDSRALALALQTLHALEALDAEEHLTPLGFHLARLPLEPRAAKMLLLGALFGCTAPVCAAAASLAFKDAFVVPLGAEDRVRAAKMRLCDGLPSDHWLLAEALRQWEQAERRGGRPAGRAFAHENFLAVGTLTLLKDMKRQFGQHLHAMGFLHSPDPDATEANRNSRNVAIVKAIVCAGLYPNIAMLKMCKQLRKGNVLKKLITPEDGPVQFHPRSINDQIRSFKSHFFVYHLKQKSTAIFLHDATMVNPLMLLLFGVESQTWNEEDIGHVIAVGEAASFQCPPARAKLIQALRRELVKLLEYKVAHPRPADWSKGNHEGSLLRTIVDLITFEDEHICHIEDGYPRDRHRDNEDMYD